MSVSGCEDTKKFRIVEAAGGAVVGEDGRVLMIFRRGMWDLPKGHREKGETLRQCALREVAEECGLRRELLRASRVLAVTEHISAPGEKKLTTWYAMSYTGPQQEAKPQTEEDIEAVEWLTPDQAAQKAKTSYETIQTVIKQLMTCNGFLSQQSSQ